MLNTNRHRSVFIIPWLDFFLTCCLISVVLPGRILLVPRKQLPPLRSTNRFLRSGNSGCSRLSLRILPPLRYRSQISTCENKMHRILLLTFKILNCDEEEKSAGGIGHSSEMGDSSWTARPEDPLGKAVFCAKLAEAVPAKSVPFSSFYFTFA